MAESLYPYQEKGAEWLAQRCYGLLADQMRLGKTPQAIRAADIAQLKPILVLCPAIARQNWSREFAKFSTRTLTTCTLTSGRVEKANFGADAVICSYDLLQNSKLLSALRQRDWAALILDEAHYLKSPEAKRTHAVLGKSGLAHRAQRVWALTGTPAPNNSSELYVLLRVFGIYRGSYDAFVAEFCTGFNGPYGFQITGTKNADKLRALLAPIMLRRTKAEVRPDLPTAQFSDIVVEPGQLAIDELEMAFSSYINDPRGWKGFDGDIAAERALVERAFNEATTEDAKLEVLGRTVKATATLRRYTGMLKTAAVIDIVKDELDNGTNKIVIFAIHKAVIDKLREGLREYGAVTLFGGTPDAKRNRHMDSFRNNPECRVFIGNIQACGTAVDLSAASEVLFVETDWVPSNNAQAAARVDGPNQRESISVRFVGLAGSIDEHVTRTLTRKTKDLQAIFGEQSASIFAA